MSNWVFFLQYNSIVEKKFYSIILLANISHLPWLINYFCCSESLLNRRRFRKRLGLSLHNCSSPDLCQEYLHRKSIAALTAKAETQLNFYSSSPQFSETNWFQDGPNHFRAWSWSGCIQIQPMLLWRGRGDLFSMSLAHRTSIRVEMHLRRLPSVIRLNSLRLNQLSVRINSLRKVQSLYLWRLKWSLDKHLSELD